MFSDVPRVFVSHASEDKDRFVLAFAERLRKDGVEAWLDKWEMLPGDSLVDRVFEEGFKDATAIIIVLSQHSVSKPWVRAELNASVVARISKKVRLIPVVIDDCEIPVSLSSILHERIKDLTSYEESYSRIQAAIWGHSLKPELGKAPGYATARLIEIDGLESIDNLVLKVSCEPLLEDPHKILEPHLLFGPTTSLNLPRQEVLDSLEVLESRAYLRVTHYVGGGGDQWGCHYSVTTYGFHEYCQAYVPDYFPLLDRAGAMIANEEAKTNFDLRDKLGLAIGFANHMIEYLEERSLLAASKEVGERMYIYQVSAELRRKFR